MTLTRVPPSPILPDPGQPFVVYALWIEGPEGHAFLTRPDLGAPDHPDALVKMAIANVPGGPLVEVAVGGSLAEQIAQVYADELPLVLALHLAQVDGHGEWRFTMIGEDPAEVWQIPADVQPQPPRPLSLEELNAGAEEQLRESLGIPPGEPIPEPAGQLPPDEQSDEPYRFDPTRHMDLGKAEPAPPLPAPAAPGPAPLESAQTSHVPELPPAGKPIGSYGDATVPFAH